MLDCPAQAFCCLQSGQAASAASQQMQQQQQQSSDQQHGGAGSDRWSGPAAGDRWGSGAGNDAARPRWGGPGALPVMFCALHLFAVKCCKRKTFVRASIAVTPRYTRRSGQMSSRIIPIFQVSSIVRCIVPSLVQSRSHVWTLFTGS